MLCRIEMKYGFGWDDAGWTEAADGEAVPLRFANRDEAQAALESFFAEVAAAVAAGDMDIIANPADYRIVEVAA